MQCREACGMVQKYIDKQLPVDDMEEFLEHISHCKDCYDELEIYYIIKRGMNQIENDKYEHSDLLGSLKRELASSAFLVEQRKRFLRLKYAVTTAVFWSLVGVFVFGMHFLAG